MSSSLLSVLPSTIAAGIQLVQLLEELKTAPFDIRDIEREVSELCSILHQLRDRARTRSNTTSTREEDDRTKQLREENERQLGAFLLNCDGVLQETSKLLGRYRKRGKIGFAERLSWSMDGQKKAEKMYKRLEASKLTLNIAVSLLTEQRVKEAGDTVDLIHGNTQTILSQINCLLERIDEDDIETSSTLVQPPSEYSFTVRRYLESASTYAGSVASDTQGDILDTEEVHGDEEHRASLQIDLTSSSRHNSLLQSQAASDARPGYPNPSPTPSLDSPEITKSLNGPSGANDNQPKQIAPGVEGTATPTPNSPEVSKIVNNPDDSCGNQPEQIELSLDGTTPNLDSPESTNILSNQDHFNDNQLESEQIVLNGDETTTPNNIPESIVTSTLSEPLSSGLLPTDNTKNLNASLKPHPTGLRVSDTAHENPTEQRIDTTPDVHAMAVEHHHGQELVHPVQNRTRSKARPDSRKRDKVVVRRMEGSRGLRRAAKDENSKQQAITKKAILDPTAALRQIDGQKEITVYVSYCTPEPDNSQPPERAIRGMLYFDGRSFSLILNHPLPRIGRQNELALFRFRVYTRTGQRSANTALYHRQRNVYY
ncbi:hypothetical protein BJ508DRAFT_414680 [Ascobolus immersus RN42]|uniref:Fungal N-terminal domain-containing protein n=1 Tax=Ascobolus immersus RN42 TaxID=1160509 RepID=A0A3N4I6B6_ASCIM|nr:hypothetical protein BJ508DRAFT_414680 [Ascobolus immersus RN42]